MILHHFTAVLNHYMFFIGRKSFIQHCLKTQNRIDLFIGTAADTKSFFKRVIDITCLADIIIQLLPNSSGYTAFPKCMDAGLIAKLSVIVDGKVQRHVRIGHVMARLAEVFKISVVSCALKALTR